MSDAAASGCRPWRRTPGEGGRQWLAARKNRPATGPSGNGTSRRGPCRWGGGGDRPQAGSFRRLVARRRLDHLEVRPLHLAQLLVKRRDARVRGRREGPVEAVVR